MIRFIAMRLLLMAWVIVGATILICLIIRLAPGDASLLIAMARHGGIDQVSKAEIETIRRSEAIGGPFVVQYGKWLHHALHGDLGCSLVDGKPVLTEILRRFPATLQLAAASLFIALLIAIPAGLLSASHPNSLFDHIGLSVALVGVSMPNFWLGLLLISLFSVHLGWLPVFGTGGINHLILPALTVGTGAAALTTRLTRSSIIDTLGCNYIRTARAKGLPERVVIGKHALKNALIPIITMVGLQFAFLLEGAVIVETIFAWPGIGRLLVEAIFSRDYAMLQGCALFMAIVFSLVNLAVDMFSAWLDPRIRYERKRA